MLRFDSYRELAERLKGTGVDVVAVCPGFTYTRLSRYSNIKWWQYLVLLPVALLYLRSPWQVRLMKNAFKIISSIVNFKYYKISTRSEETKDKQ